MSALRVIAAIARADFLERVRRYSFLLTLLFALFLGYWAATGRIALQLGEYRGVYTSAWIGALVAVTTTCFVSLVGFYIVKSAVDRDRITGVGQILAATPLSKTAYTLGKFISNFAVLGATVLVLAVCAIFMQVFAGEDPHFNGVALLSPFLLVALPTMALTAGFAVLFETLPLLRGGIGNIAWFFLWSILGIGLPEISGNHRLDPMGLMVVSDSMMAGARANIPGYKNSFSFTVADTPVKIVQSFHWPGVSWTAEDIFLRGVWTAAAIALALLAALVFDRFDPSRSLAPSLRGQKQRPQMELPGNSSPAAPVGSTQAHRAKAVHLTALTGSAKSNAFFRIFLAELRLSLKGLRWWWYAIAVGLLVAQFVTPLAVSRGILLGGSWIWPVLIWSSMGARESHFGMRAMLFSSAGILSRQLPACWLAGFATTLLTGAGTIFRLVAAHDGNNLFGVLAGAVFVPSLALGFGVVSGSSKFFEGFYTFLWYAGPMNHTYGLDYTSAASGPHVISIGLRYVAIAAVLCAVAYVFRARQLRGN
ncbi:MAG TPA: hypothetical protein VN025_18600 [Candidatus Dormibacteraeota bacterium]|nr:hypothetical protein [Candidatus Dormibacteraeota bacterium]